MPAVKFLACLDLERKSSFLDEHEVVSERKRSKGSNDIELPVLTSVVQADPHIRVKRGCCEYLPIRMPRMHSHAGAWER